MGRNARIGLFVIFLSVILMPLVSLPVDSVCPPGITITIAQPKQTAYVAPGQDCIVTFTGTVEAQVPWESHFQYLVVQLSPVAECWPTSNPPSLIFTRQTRIKTFSVDVYIPTGTSRSYQGQFSMGGTWRFQNTTKGGTLYTATAIILVEQYHQIEMGSPERYIKIEQGDSLRTYVKIENQGNGNERLKAGIHNPKELASKGWKIDLTPDRMTVEEGNSTMLSLELSSSDTMELGVYNLSVVISIPGGQGEDPIIFYHRLFIEVREREMLGIELSLWIIFEYSMIILLGMVASLMVMLGRRSPKTHYSKLSRTRE
ncbi:MAG: choice-of-anchor T family protein [Thermoplasmatota archaeon]